MRVVKEIWAEIGVRRYHPARTAFQKSERRHSNTVVLSDPCSSDAARLLCDGEVYGYGEGQMVYEEKVVARGGITCKDCLEKLREYKAVKL